jgi:hypothetical protein
MDGRTDAQGADQQTADEADGAARGCRASTQKAPGPGNALSLFRDRLSTEHDHAPSTARHSRRPSTGAFLFLISLDLFFNFLQSPSKMAKRLLKVCKLESARLTLAVSVFLCLEHV